MTILVPTENRIKILNGALDELPDGSIILRGVIDQNSLLAIQADHYQRGIMKRDDILTGYREGAQMPDVELGMRGADFDSKGRTFILKHPVFAIDGWQRISTARRYLEMIADGKVHLGAMVRFNTDERYERERFEVLNGSSRSKVSVNIMMRNRRGDSPAVLMLYGLSHTDKTFSMQNRIAWGQSMARGELLTAFGYIKIAGFLHSHKIAGKNNNHELLLAALDRGTELYGIQVMRDNVKAFFDLVDECWGIRRIHYRDGASYMKSQFLYVLAKLLSDHHDFWKQPEERRLFVEAPLRRKLAQFPINDPQVVQLSGASGKSQEILYMLLRDHLNRGKTTKRLASRHAESVSSFEDDAEAA
jgi:hypothetical protein